MGFRRRPGLPNRLRLFRLLFDGSGLARMQKIMVHITHPLRADGVGRW